MMKRLDGEISRGEDEKLRRHMEACAVCAESLETYGEMLEIFAGGERPEAPAGFEAAVMERVKALPEGKISRAVSEDAAFGAVAGAVSVVFGLGVLMFVCREGLAEGFAEVPALSGLAGTLPDVRAFADALAVRLGAEFRAFMPAALETADAVRWIIALAASVLAAARLAYLKIKTGKGNA
jgi:anti-sigma factor RsiW